MPSAQHVNLVLGPSPAFERLIRSLPREGADLHGLFDAELVLDDDGGADVLLTLTEQGRRVLAELEAGRQA